MAYSYSEVLGYTKQSGHIVLEGTAVLVYSETLIPTTFGHRLLHTKRTLDSFRTVINRTYRQ